MSNAMLTACRICYPVWYEQQRHSDWNKSLTFILPERLAEKVWWTKSLSSLLNIYIRLSGIQSLLRIRYDPDACSHCTKMWHQKMSYPVCVVTLQRSARRGFAPIQKSCRNHRSCVWKEALSGMVFVPAKCHPVQGEHSLSPSLRHLSTLGIYSRPRANYTAHDPLSFAIG